MKDSKKISEDSLEEMLTNYCNRKPERVFELREEKGFMKANSFFKTAAVGVCAVAVLAVGLFSDVMPFNLGGKASDNSFTINACATEFGNMNVELSKMTDIKDHSDGYGGVTIESQKLFFFLDNEEKTLLSNNEVLEFLMSAGAESEWNGEKYSFDKTEVKALLESEDVKYKGYNVLMESEYVVDSSCVAINVTGNNIKSFDVTSHTGILLLYNKLTGTFRVGNEVYKDTDGDGNYSGEAVFPIGGTFFDIATEEDRPEGVMIAWSGGGSTLYDEEELSKEVETYDDLIAYNEVLFNTLSTAEGYTKFFGDILEIKVNYKDGTSETQIIDISLDENGNYQLHYR